MMSLFLNAVTALGAAVCIAYFGFRHGTGVLTVIPDDVAAFFLRNDWLQWVGLGLVVAALIAKLPIIHEQNKRRRETEV